MLLKMVLSIQGKVYCVLEYVKTLSFILIRTWAACVRKSAQDDRQPKLKWLKKFIKIHTMF